MSGPGRTRRLAGAGLGLTLSALAGFAGCMTSDPARPSGLPIPPSALSDAPLTLTRRFPSEARPGARFNGCLFASPLAIDDGAARRVLVADGGGEVAALDPLTGAKVWSVVLPAPAGEQGFALSTPVVVGRRLVVSYHTVAAGHERPTVNLPRLRHRLAVIDLDAHAIDPAFPTVDVTATVKGHPDAITFTPSHVLQRSALMHVVPPGAGAPRDGRVYVMYGNARDVQPYHGWLVELDLGAWRAGGAAKAIAAVRTTTEDSDCGTEGGDGSRDTRCGAGLWSPGGPLVMEEGNSYALVVPVGNGQLDLARGDYANTLMRFGPGLTFEDGCEATKCRDFSSETLPRACVDTCRDLFVPRLLSDESAPPYCAGIEPHESPSSQALRITAIGNSPLWSCAAAIGLISSWAKRRAVSCSASCSSDREKSMASLDRAAQLRGGVAHAA